MKIAARLLLAGACVASLTAAAQADPVGTGGGRAILYELPNYQGRSVTIQNYNNNLADTGFNDMAQSGHFDGDWTVCTDSDFRGSCTRVAGDVPNLNSQGVGRSISSLQQNAQGGRDDRGRNDGRGYNEGRGGDDNRGGYGDNRGGYGDNRGGYGDNRGGYPDDRGPGYNPGGPYNPNAGGFAYGSRNSWDGGFPGRSAVFFPRPSSNGQEIAAYDRSAADWFCRRQGLGAAIYYDVSQRGRGFRWQNGVFTTNAPVLRDVLCRR